MDSLYRLILFILDLLEDDVSETPRCWLSDLIHSQMATGNFGKMARDAVAKAMTDGRKADADLYAAMEAQIADYWADLQGA